MLRSTAADILIAVALFGVGFWSGRSSKQEPAIERIAFDQVVEEIRLSACDGEVTTFLNQTAPPNLDIGYADVVVHARVKINRFTKDAWKQSAELVDVIAVAPPVGEGIMVVTMDAGDVQMVPNCTNTTQPSS